MYYYYRFKNNALLAVQLCCEAIGETNNAPSIADVCHRPKARASQQH